MKFYGKGIPNVNADDLTGKLIVIEGADGSGRSTQIRLLTDFLEGRGYGTVNVGLKRSNLVSAELEQAMQGNVLSQGTLSLFYATDFMDQLENNIIPALRAGFIVLADRYIYTLIARDILRGSDPGWLQTIYSLALVPDAVNRSERFTEFSHRTDFSEKSFSGLLGIGHGCAHVARYFRQLYQISAPHESRIPKDERDVPF